MEYKLSVFINNLSFSNKLIGKVYSLINEKRMSDVWIKRSIQRGHHIELYSHNLAYLNELEIFLTEALKNYTPVNIEKTKLMKQIITVSSAENTEAKIEIRPDGTLLLEEIANLQLKNQQMENNLIDTIMRIENIDEKTFMKDEEE